MAEEDPSEMHRLLSRLPIFVDNSVEEIASHANRMMTICPPKELVKLSRCQLKM